MKERAVSGRVIFDRFRALARLPRPAAIAKMPSMTTYEQKITFGEMRESGVPRCADLAAITAAAIDRADAG